MTAQRLLPTIALGIASQMVAIAIWYALRTYLDFDPMMFWFFFVLPVGAFCLGAVGATGFLLAKPLHVRAGKTLLVTILVTGFIAAVAMQYLAYATSSAANIMDFGDYLQLSLGNTTMSTDRSGTMELGSLGYLMAAWAAIVYAGAGWLIYEHLRDSTYCDRCERYSDAVSRDVLHFPSIEALHDFRHALPVDPPERLRQLRAARPVHEADGKAKGAGVFTAKHAACPTCGAQHLAETVAVVTKNGLSEQKADRRQFDWVDPRGAAASAL